MKMKGLEIKNIGCLLDNFAIGRRKNLCKLSPNGCVDNKQVREIQNDDLNKCHVM